jgi:hypothetical protein
MIPTILQILLPCYFATNLTSASENMSTSLFYSNWQKESKDLKSTIKIVMEMSKKNIVVRSFGVFEVNLEKFLAILNSAYSLYAVLRSVSLKN